MDTMTLEELREHIFPTSNLREAIDAAIRERDERDASMRTMQDLTREVCIAQEAVRGLNVRLADCTERAQKAEAGLAAIKSATCAWTHDLDEDTWDSACGERWAFDDGGPRENNVRFCHGCGKRVRLLVEGDDV